MLLYLGLMANVACGEGAAVPLRPNSGDMLIVPVRLNGAGPYDFIVDTGSSSTVLEWTLFQELGLRASGRLRSLRLIGRAAR